MWRYFNWTFWGFVVIYQGCLAQDHHHEGMNPFDPYSEDGDEFNHHPPPPQYPSDTDDDYSFERRGKFTDEKDGKIGLSASHIALLAVVSVLTVIIVALIIVCAYKHKQALSTRQTAPGRIYGAGTVVAVPKMAPYDLFHTDTSGKKPMTKQFDDVWAWNKHSVRPKTPPPRYTEKPSHPPEVEETEMRPSRLDFDQPPPYVVAIGSVPPYATEL